MPWKTQVPHFGPSGAPETFAETSLPNSRQQLGYVFERGTKRWQLVRAVTTVAAAGDVLYWSNPGVTYDVTATIPTGGVNLIAGVAELATTSTNTYIWVRQGGVMDVKSEAALDGAGDLAIGNGANNSLTGANAGAAAMTFNVPVGVALAARAAGKTSTLLNIASL